MKSPKEQWEELQEQNLQLLKSQQETYLEGIKAWRAQMTAAGAPATGSQSTSGFGGQPAWQGTPSFPAFPTPEQIAEINQTYLQRIADQQQDFLRRLAELGGQPS
jgi:hypothetical protein